MYVNVNVCKLVEKLSTITQPLLQQPVMFLQQLFIVVYSACSPKWLELWCCLSALK